MLIKTFLYTGVRVSELVAIRLEDVDLDRCEIWINQGKGSKDRVVPFPHSFREVLAFQIERMQEQQAAYLFASSRQRKPYTDRGIRKIIARYAEAAGLRHKVSPHKRRHFLLTWLKKLCFIAMLISHVAWPAYQTSAPVFL